MDAWDLFEQDFKQGDEVIIVNSQDLVDFGTLKYDEKGFTLESGSRPKRSYTWHQCTFMAKDGFPVRKIFGRFPKGPDITSKQDALRIIAADDFQTHEERTVARKKESEYGIRFGCPFETDPCLVQVFNPGCFGQEFDLTSMEETLRLTHSNGTVAQLWQLTEIFDFGR